jgi:hypothetical protein
MWFISVTTSFTHGPRIGMDDSSMTDRRAGGEHAELTSPRRRPLAADEQSASAAPTWPEGPRWSRAGRPSTSTSATTSGSTSARRLARFDQNVTGFIAEEDFAFTAEPPIRTGKLVKITGIG